jgi:hypothetical protein
MKTQKMSLSAIQGKLSRAEMKGIMAGSGSATYCFARCSGHTGSWHYTGGVGRSTCQQDLGTYCRSGGTCYHC